MIGAESKIGGQDFLKVVDLLFESWINRCLDQPTAVFFKRRIVVPTRTGNGSRWCNGYRCSRICASSTFFTFFKLFDSVKCLGEFGIASASPTRTSCRGCQNKCE